MKTLVFSFLFLSTSAFSQSFMPPNDLDKYDTLDSRSTSGITEVQFNSVIDRAEKIFKPIIAAHGASFTVNRLWTDSTVNANASQPSDTHWEVNMYGGLARRKEVTEDGFALVLCHEIGHQVGGYPYTGSQDWAANEGQSDLFATMACAWKVFSQDTMRGLIAQDSLPASVIALCDAHHKDVTMRGICYRTMLAGKSLADLLAALGSTKAAFDTPDKTIVGETDNNHPAAQCRLDTYMAGAICGNYKWDYSLIPGKGMDDQNSIAAQKEAFDHSCSVGPYTEGTRPLCWFHPLGATDIPVSN